MIMKGRRRREDEERVRATFSSSPSLLPLCNERVLLHQSLGEITPNKENPSWGSLNQCLDVFV